MLLQRKKVWHWNEYFVSGVDLRFAPMKGFYSPDTQFWAKECLKGVFCCCSVRLPRWNSWFSGLDIHSEQNPGSPPALSCSFDLCSLLRYLWKRREVELEQTVVQRPWRVLCLLKPPPVCHPPSHWPSHKSRSYSPWRNVTLLWCVTPPSDFVTPLWLVTWLVNPASMSPSPRGAQR